MYGDLRVNNFRHQLLSSPLLARGLLSFPCVEKDSSHRSVEESQESFQGSKNERIREKVKTRRETGDNVYFTGILKESKIMKLD